MANNRKLSSVAAVAATEKEQVARHPENNEKSAAYSPTGGGL
jgi:hypothetical protein